MGLDLPIYLFLLVNKLLNDSVKVVVYNGMLDMLVSTAGRKWN